MTKKAFESIMAGLKDAKEYFESMPLKIRKQYHFRNSPQGLLAWDIQRLVRDAKALPIIEVELSGIRELDEAYWVQDARVKPSCRNVAEHAKLIREVDTKYPILLFSDGSVVDGMHRVCRALIDGQQTIRAVQFMTDPPPDFVGKNPEELPYD